MGKVLNLVRIPLISISLFLLFCACADEGCTEPTTSFTIASLTQKVIDQKSVVQSVSVYGIDQKDDTVMVKNQRDLKILALLLNQDTTYTQMRFEFAFTKDTIKDTLSFYYKNQAYFLSIDCGCSVFNYLDSVSHTNHLIQNIEIINPEVKNEKTPNITLYY